MLETPPWEDIPDVGLVPAGTYTVSISELELSTTKGSDTKAPKACAKLQYAVVEPIGLAGMPIFDNFTIGTEDDPDADVAATWQKSYGARRFNRMLKKVGLELSGRGVSDVCAEAIDQQLTIIVTEQTEPALDQYGNANPYAGKKRNNVDQYYSVGEREPGLADGATTAAPTPAPKPVAAATRPPTAAKPAPAARPAAPVPPAKTVVAKTVKCRTCNELVPRVEYADHVEACEAAHAGASA